MNQQFSGAGIRGTVTGGINNAGNHLIGAKGECVGIRDVECPGVVHPIDLQPVAAAVADAIHRYGECVAVAQGCAASESRGGVTG